MALLALQSLLYSAIVLFIFVKQTKLVGFSLLDTNQLHQSHQGLLGHDQESNSRQYSRTTLRNLNSGCFTRWATTAAASYPKFDKKLWNIWFCTRVQQRHWQQRRRRLRRLTVETAAGNPPSSDSFQRLRFWSETRSQPEHPNYLISHQL